MSSFFLYARINPRFPFPRMSDIPALRSLADVDLYHVLLTRHEGYRVVSRASFDGGSRWEFRTHPPPVFPVNQMMSNPDRLSRTAERVAEDFCWAQWDGRAQRIYFLTHSAPPSQSSTWQAGSDWRSERPRDQNFLLRCVQFHLNHHWETVVSQFSQI